MHSFVKNVLPLLFLLCSLFNNEALAASKLEGVKLESSSINTSGHGDITSPECVTSSTVVRHRVIDEYTTSTINSYNSQYLSRDCRKKTELYDISVYWSDCSFRGTDSTSRDDGENCNEATIDRTNLTLALIGGSVRVTVSVSPNWYLTVCASLCSLPFEYGGYIAKSGESSHTFTIDCQEDKTIKLLYIKAEGFITSETQPTGMEFLINGFSPSSIYPEDIYSDLNKVYVWSGVLKWKIPIDKKCGENITITPSVANGYGQAVIKSIKATDCEVNVDVFPSDVKPKKTGNNITAITISLADSAPQGGQFVDLTVEPIDGSGGHSHDGSRPKGEITDNDGNKINTIFFAEGETEKRAKYKASEIAGEEKIIAEIRGGLTKCEETVKVQVPWLFDLGVGGTYIDATYRLTGSTGTHPANHFGTDSTIVSINYMADDFYEQFNATLGINDMSLSGGGLFDICGTWSSSGTCSNAPYGGHSSHRKGTSVDIDRCAQSTVPNNSNPRGNCPNGWIQVNRARIERICTNRGGRLVPEGTIHCEITGGVSSTQPPPPIGGGGGDTGGGLVE